MAEIKIKGDISGSTTIKAPDSGSDEIIELSSALAEKLPYSYGTATPSTTTSGFLWYDSNSTPAATKFWDGSAFIEFGGLTLLSTTTLSGSSTTISVAANSFVYLVAVAEGIDCSTDVDVYLQINSLTGASAYAPIIHASNDGVAAVVSAKTNGVYFNIPGGQGFGTGNNWAVVTRFLNPNKASAQIISSETAGVHSNGALISQRNTVIANGSAVISGITYKVASGTFDGGTVKVYGGR